MTKDLKQTDSFYTKSEIAKRFVQKVDSLINLSSFDYVIEPSAGSGRILDFLPKTAIGVDIHPERDDIIKSNWFDYMVESSPLYMDNPSIAIVGNPPFGSNSKLAVEFFLHAASMDAQAIAFIVPRSWMKFSVQNRLPRNYDLMWSAVLPDDSFTFGDDDYSVRCVAQLWVRDYFMPGWKGHGEIENWNSRIETDQLRLIQEYYKDVGCITGVPNVTRS